MIHSPNFVRKLVLAKIMAWETACPDPRPGVLVMDGFIIKWISQAQTSKIHKIGGAIFCFWRCLKLLPWFMHYESIHYEPIYRHRESFSIILRLHPLCIHLEAYWNLCGAFHQAFGQRCDDIVPNACWVCADMLPTFCRQCADFVLTSCRPCASLVPTLCGAHGLNISSIYSSG